MRSSICMEKTLILVCQVQPSQEQVAKIEATLKAFASACNYANQTVKLTIISKTTIQSLVDDQVKEKFG